MRLFFEDPAGGRLAIDTERKEYCCDYLDAGTKISDNHRFIQLQRAADLYIVTSEADFCAWSYGDSWLQDQEQYSTAHGGDVYDSDPQHFD